MSAYDDMLATARALTDDELVSSAQGCTELSCPYHGAYNLVLRERQDGER